MLLLKTLKHYLQISFGLIILVLEPAKAELNVTNMVIHQLVKCGLAGTTAVQELTDVLMKIQIMAAVNVI